MKKKFKLSLQELFDAPRQEVMSESGQREFEAGEILSESNMIAEIWDHEDILNLLYYCLPEIKYENLVDLLKGNREYHMAESDEAKANALIDTMSKLDDNTVLLYNYGQKDIFADELLCEDRFMYVFDNEVYEVISIGNFIESHRLTPMNLFGGLHPSKELTYPTEETIARIKRLLKYEDVDSLSKHSSIEDSEPKAQKGKDILLKEFDFFEGSRFIKYPISGNPYRELEIQMQELENYREYERQELKKSEERYKKRMEENEMWREAELEILSYYNDEPNWADEEKSPYPDWECEQARFYCERYRPDDHIYNFFEDYGWKDSRCDMGLENIFDLNILKYENIRETILKEENILNLHTYEIEKFINCWTTTDMFTIVSNVIKTKEVLNEEEIIDLEYVLFTYTNNHGMTKYYVYFRKVNVEKVSLEEIEGLKTEKKEAENSLLKPDEEEFHSGFYDHLDWDDGLF